MDGGGGGGGGGGGAGAGAGGGGAGGGSKTVLIGHSIGTDICLHAMYTLGTERISRVVGRGLHSFPFQLNLSLFCPPHNPT